jgi:hypothetical protein
VVLAAGCAWPAHPDHLPAGLEVSWGSNKRHASSNEVAGAEWSGRDQRGRLVFTRSGCLYWQRNGKSASVLADFNGEKPDPQPAPEWATRPLIDKRGKKLI